MKINKVLEKFFDTLAEMGTEGVMAYLSVQAPFVNLPVIKQIIKAIIGKILKLAMHQTELGTYFLVVDIATAKEAKDFEKVALELETAKTKGDADEIKRLEQSKIDAARKLIRIKPY